MIDIVPHIQYLVSRYDCVVIPGWGALLRSDVPASERGNKLFPPSRVLSFNADIDHNDGMLATSIARREGISYDTASMAVVNAVAEMGRIYAASGTLEIPRVGTFNRISSTRMSFTPALPDESIVCARFAALPEIELTHANSDSDAIERGRKIAALAGLRRFGKVAAAIAVLVVLSVTLTTPVSIDRTGLNYASIEAPKVTAAKAVTIPMPMPEDATLRIPTPPANDAEEMPQQSETAVDKQIQVQSSISAAGPFYLVVSSHSTAAEAKRYIAARPTENLSIIEGAGRYRVYAAAGTSAEDARRAGESNPQIMRLHPDAWVCYNR